MILANIELFKNNTIGVTLLMIVSMIIMYVLDMEYFGQWYMFQYKNSQISYCIHSNYPNNLNNSNEAVLFFFLSHIFFIFEAVGVFWSVSVGGWSTRIR